MERGAKQVFGLALLALLGILFIALCIPLRVQALLHVDDAGPSLQITVRWAFWRSWRYDSSAAVPPRPARQGKTQAKQDQAKAKGKAKVKTASAKAARFDFSQLSLAWNLWRRYWRSLFRLLRLSLSGSFVVELDDPALVGNLFGLAGATHWPPPSLQLELQFGYNNRIDGDVQLLLTVYPLEVGWLLLRVASEPPVRRIIWAKITKKGEKQGERIR